MIIFFYNTRTKQVGHLEGNQKLRARSAAWALDTMVISPKLRWNIWQVNNKYLAELFMLKLPSHSVWNLTCSRSYDQTQFILKRSQSTQCSRRRSGSCHRSCHGKRIWRREQAHTQILTIHPTGRTGSSDFGQALCRCLPKCTVDWNLNLFVIIDHWYWLFLNINKNYVPNFHSWVSAVILQSV